MLLRNEVLASCLGWWMRAVGLCGRLSCGARGQPGARSVAQRCRLLREPLPHLLSGPGSKVPNSKAGGAGLSSRKVFITCVGGQSREAVAALSVLPPISAPSPGTHPLPSLHPLPLQAS
jgi:hypothetical protein